MDGQQIIANEVQIYWINYQSYVEIDKWQKQKEISKGLRAPYVPFS